MTMILLPCSLYGIVTLREQPFNTGVRKMASVIYQKGNLPVDIKKHPLTTAKKSGRKRSHLSFQDPLLQVLIRHTLR